MPTSETAPNRADEAQVTSGRGDSPAASIARLLVHGMMEQGAGANRIIDDLTGSAAQDVQHGTAAGGSLGTGGAAHVPASSPIAVAELLSGRDEQVGGIESLARSLQTSGSPGRFQATMRLDPPELGQVSVQIKMRDGVMTLNVQTENAGVTRLIESRMGDLHDALAEHGIRVEHTHVVTKSSETADARNELSRQRSSEFTQNEQGPSSSWTRHQDQPGWRGSAGHDGASDGGSADWTPSRSTDEFANQSIAMTQQWPPIREGSVNLVA
ncbi:MAG TPA: flagellar hook-length control protein FliK [Phycisphaerae bacterium]|nr:flagellar hook-length control protein FliK [Phycisphaerae bacterium]